MSISAILWFLAVIMTVVFIHELGHFSVARFFGVKIDIFSIGFGKKLFSWNDSKGTEWRVCLIPLGGYVKMHGEMLISEKETAPQGNDLFISKPLLQKAAIVLAGPLANYILAILILSIIIVIHGQVVTMNEVTSLKENGPAAIAGVEVGDVIVKIDDRTTNNLSDVYFAISMHTNIQEPVIIDVIRDGQSLQFQSSIVLDEKMQRPIIGLGFSKTQTIQLSISESVLKATMYCYKTSVLMLEAIWQMLTGQRGTSDLGSIGKIADYTTKSMEHGWMIMFTNLALLSLNLGLLNLLPIPVLDGGHLLYYGIQAIIRRPVPYKIQMIGMKLGVIVIITLMALGMINDIKEFIIK